VHTLSVCTLINSSKLCFYLPRVRLQEVRDAPVLFSDGTTRYDMGQGSAGTCWFLSMVALLADKPDLFHRVSYDQDRFHTVDEDPDILH